MDIKERTADVLQRIEHLLPLFDHRNYLDDACTCDQSVNYQCELCVTYDTLREAKSVIELLKK